MTLSLQIDLITLNVGQSKLNSVYFSVYLFGLLLDAI